MTAAASSLRVVFWPASSARPTSSSRRLSSGMGQVIAAPFASQRSRRSPDLNETSRSTISCPSADKEMIMIPLKLLITMMAVAEEGCSYDLDVPWPLHVALVGLAHDSAQISIAVPWEIPLAYVDDAGRGVAGLDATVHELYVDRVLVPDAD